MSLQWIRQQYGVPAKRGARVLYAGNNREQYGTIVSASGGYLNVRLDGEKAVRPYHPTWKLFYVNVAEGGAP